MSEQLQKLQALSRSCFDVALPEAGPGAGRGSGRLGGGYLKMLLHGTCSFGCAYCGICKQGRAPSFAPLELATLICCLWRTGRINGLFLSTGIPRDSDQSMNDLIETATLLRQKGFSGYLHLKVVPGALRTDINEAARLADRISINLEAVSKSRLSEIAPVKNYESDLLRRHGWVAEAAPGRHTTQIVVGAAEETDSEILSFMHREYKKYTPASIYYSGFIPLPATPLAGAAPANPARLKGLYAVDALVRVYGYSPDETQAALDGDGWLLPGDPKVNAAGSLWINPSSASREELIRIPGIGPKAADRIIRMRQSGHPVSEAGTEAGSEARTQVVTEAMTKAGTKAGTEAMTKAGTKAGTEVIKEVLSEAGTKAGTNAGTKAGTQVVTEAMTNAGIKVGTKVMTNAGTEAMTKAGTKVMTNAGTEAMTKAGTKAGTQVVTEEMLREAGVQMKRAGPYLVIGGRVQGQLV